LKTITFGGEQIVVTTYDNNNERKFEYNNNSVFLSSIIEFMQSPFSISHLTPTIIIKKEGKNIKIGCLTDTQERLRTIINNL